MLWNVLFSKQRSRYSKEVHKEIWSEVKKEQEISPCRAIIDFTDL